MDKYFRYVNDLMTRKGTKYLVMLLAVVGYGFFVFKNNNSEIKKRMKIINEKRKQIDLAKNIKTKEDLEDFINKNKSVMFDEEKKQEKQEINKKTELIPDEEQMPNLKTEEAIKQPMSVAYKLQDLDKYYEKRLKAKKIDYNRKIKVDDIIYFDLKVKYVIKDMPQLQENEASKSKSIIILGKKLPMTRFFINKKIGSKVEFTAEELFKYMPKEERAVFESEKKAMDENIKQEKNVDVNNYIDLSGIHFTYTILDIFPQSVIKELKLDK